MYRLKLVLLSLLFVSLQSPAASGFRQITLPASDSAARALEMTVWYPTASQAPIEKAGENPAFVGVDVIPNAPPLPGAHPLLVLSHGYNGNWRNLSWIATAMSAEGYIVAAVDHPGTTTFNQNVAEAKKLWRRPQDLSQVINALIADPGVSGEVDVGRIAALGHSLGGWTVMALAGARFDTERFTTDCRQHALLAGCHLRQKLGFDLPSSRPELLKNYRDKRVKAIVALDAGAVRGFSPESLATIHLPLLILAAGVDTPEVDSGLESGYLASGAAARWVTFERVYGATHFSFMQQCKTGAEALINEDSPGEGVICHDGDGVTRADIHQRLIQQISLFLNAALDYRPPVGETG